MIKTTTKLTKNELIEIANNLQNKIDNQDNTITWQQVTTTAHNLWQETISLIQDCYRLGQWTRQQVEAVRVYVR